MRKLTSTLAFGIGIALLGTLLVAQPSHAQPLDDGAAFVSDDFASGVLDPSVWTVTDPAGNGEVTFPGAGTGNARLGLSVPAGQNYDIWGTNRSLRATQPVTDQDFEAHARFLSIPTAKYQTQGILVEQDTINWMRFDIHSTGSKLRIFAAKTVDGTSTQLLQKTITATGEIHLRLTRTGNAWALAHSTNGTTWTTAGTVNHAIQANRLGPFASNASPYPAFTADIDFFFDTANPIDPEDDDTATTLTTTTNGQGTITRDPDQPTYPAGTDVTLTATPATGWTFTGWTGHATGTNPTTTITINAATTITATFQQDAPPDPGSAAFVSDDFASGVLDPSVWTVTDPAGNGEVTFPGAGTGNARLGLTVPAGKNYDIWGTNRALRATQPIADQDFEAQARFLSTPTAKYQTQGILIEQDTTNWMRFDVHSTGSKLRIFAAKTVNGSSTQLLQKTITAGTEIQLKLTRTGDDWTLAYSTNATTWTTAGTVNHTIQANHIGPFASNASPYPAFTADIDFFFDTASPIDPEDDDTATTHTLTTNINGQGTITRDPDQPAYPEGTDVTLTATPANGWTFTGWTGHATGTNPTTTVTMNTARTITATFQQEDNEPPDPDTHELTVSVVGQGVVDQTPAPGPYTDGTEVTLTANPATGWAFTGWTGDASGSNPTTAVTMDGPRTVTATFEPVPTDPPTVDIWYGDDQTFGYAGRSQQWVNILGNVSDADGIQNASYRLNDGSPVGLSLGPDLRRLYGAGDFNVQIPYNALNAGTNVIAITATDASGESATETVTVDKDVQSPSFPYSASWATSANPNDVAQVVDGKWASGSDGLTVVEPGYDRTVAIGDVAWEEYEVEVPVTVRGLTPGHGTPQSGTPLVGLGVHWNGHTTQGSEQPARGWYPTGAFAWYRWQQEGRFSLSGNDGSPIDREGMTWDFATTYVMKVRAESVAGGTEYSYKWWPQNSIEPTEWTVSLIENDGPDNGGVLLIAHHVDATFGNVQVTPLTALP